MKPTQAEVDAIRRKPYGERTFCGEFLVCGTCDFCKLKLDRDSDLIERPLFRSDDLPLFSPKHPAPKFSLIKWIKDLLFPPKLSKDSYVEVVHYWDNVKGEEFKGSAEAWKLWCRFIGRKP